MDGLSRRGGNPEAIVVVGGPGGHLEAAVAVVPYGGGCLLPIFP